MEPSTTERVNNMKEKYGVLVVDDSAFMRKTISTIIEECPSLFVIGKARNGLDAVEKVKKMKPDIITLDIEMPEADGLKALQMIMADNPVPVVMLSNGEESTLESFELGAVDFVVKETLVNNLGSEEIAGFHQRLITAAQAKLPVPLQQENKVLENKKKKIPSQSSRALFQQEEKNLIIIGSSTGGPSALQTILTQFPEDFHLPILVIQHMPPGFTKPLADRFDGLCRMHVKEAEHNEKLTPGTVYIAPAGLQTTLSKDEQANYILKLKISASIETLYKPSIDVALLSVASLTKDEIVTVILTGMGEDGLRGCKAMKQSGGIILSESEETCIVYGMPKVVYEAGLSDKQIPLYEMFEHINAAL